MNHFLYADNFLWSALWGHKKMLLAGEIDSNKFGADLFGLYLKPGGILWKKVEDSQ